VALVLHRGGGYLACHHCGHRERAPTRCGECSSMSVARHGTGTERLQHELSTVLDDGGFPIFRLDADAIATPPAVGGGGEVVAAGEVRRVGENGAGALLRRFQEAESGALIGTQMVAKGHDFPDVALGVVLDADATLRFPDFRAEERTFALIAQLAGRVGRGGEGRVLVQTIAPEERSIAFAARHDSDGFLVGELDRRRALGYPPFSHLIRIVCSAVEPDRAAAAATAVRQALAERLSGGAELELIVLGPAILFRLRGRERRALVVKAAERRRAVRAVGEAVQRVAGTRRHGGVSFSVDVDPQ
jgi:primosomal protein N' (replication factor Y) (superfamily II helicase)